MAACKDDQPVDNRASAFSCQYETLIGKEQRPVKQVGACCLERSIGEIHKKVLRKLLDSGCLKERLEVAAKGDANAYEWLKDHWPSNRESASTMLRAL
jgi:hypothetical protein